MNAVQTFTFDVDSITHGIRVVEIDGAPWFVAQDAAAALGLYTAGGAGGYTRHLAADEKMVVKRSSMGRLHDWPTRGFVCVSEAGLYKLVMRSDKPEAAKFRDWVARDVLPSIRKNGGYIAGQEKLASGELSDAEFLARSHCL